MKNIRWDRLVLPVGGFLTLGCLIALMQWAQGRGKKKEGK